jgi:hypothetical protein
MTRCRTLLALAPLVAAAPAAAVHAASDRQVAAEALQINFSSHLTVGQSALVVSVRGELRRSERWLKDGESWRSFKLVGPEVNVWRNGQPQEPLAGASEVFAVRSGSRGELVELAFPPAMPPDTRALVQALAAMMQRTCPQHARAKTWTSQERDGSGRYDARYERQPGGWTRKTKLRYVGVPLELAVVRSEINFRGECAAGAPDEVAAVEVLAEGTLGLRAESSLSLRRREGGATPPPNLVGGLSAGHDRRAPGAVTDAAASPSRGSGADETIRLEAALDQMQSSSSTTFPWKVTMALSERLRRQPEELGKLESYLRALPERVPALGQLLVNVDSPASRDVLDRLLEDEALPDRVRMQLLTELLWAPSAHRATIDRVHALAACGREALAAVAANTEGSLLAKVRRGGATDMAPLVRRYVEAFRRAPTPRLRGAYLDGLSYVGGPEALAELRGSLEGKDPALRVRAVGALESTKDVRAEAWLVERLRVDKDEGVRERAARACGNRGTRTCLKALERALLHDRGTRVRLRAIDGLASAPGAGDGDRALAHALRADASASVRDAAKRALDRLAEQRQRRAAKSGGRPAAQPG